MTSQVVGGYHACESDPIPLYCSVALDLPYAVALLTAETALEACRSHASAGSARTRARVSSPGGASPSQPLPIPGQPFYLGERQPTVPACRDEVVEAGLRRDGRRRVPLVPCDGRQDDVADDAPGPPRRNGSVPIFAPLSRKGEGQRRIALAYLWAVR